MSATNFSNLELAGESVRYQLAVDDLRHRFGFDFISIGLTAFLGAPLKWIYSAGATGERYRRIVLTPGHGIGGIVIKAGKPMMFIDIDSQIGPRAYSSYPIVFAEDLHSFCALPLMKSGRVVGVLLCAFRSVGNHHSQVYAQLVDYLQERLCDLDVVSQDFIDFEQLATQQIDLHDTEIDDGYSSLSRAIAAQESERKRISRELHDGIAQELLGVSFLVDRLAAYADCPEAHAAHLEARNNINRILDDIHNLSVELRPSTLDHLGLVPALRSRAIVFEKTYGARIVIEGSLSADRLDEKTETQVYRICQEAILNACKYSESDSIRVSLKDSDGWLQASISDQGHGFDVENPVIKGSGCGLSGMRERAHLIGADFTIVSSEDGTVVTLKAPMQLEEGRERDEK